MNTHVKNNWKIKFIFIFLLFLQNSFLQAQSAEKVLSGNAKFNAVSAVLIAIFCGLLAYMIYLDKKISKK